MPESSTSLSAAVLVFDKYMWVAAGAFAVYAVYTTQSQLKTFKKRCVSKPSPSSSSDAAVDRNTEDGSSSSTISKRDSRMTEQILTMDSTAIKLETLEALARGINFDLRNAALKIITERATTDKNIDFLLKQIESRNVPARLRALKAVRCLSMSASLSILPYCGQHLHRDSGSFIICTQKTFRALVICLNNTLPPTSDVAAQKEALYILARLMTSFFQGKDMAVEAGIIGWLRQVQIPGYNNVVDAVSDPERFDANDMSLWEIVHTIMDEHDGGRKLLIDAGLMAAAVEGGDEDERGMEVEVEVEIIDAATAQRAQRAWEEVGALDGLLQENSFPGESAWTQG